MLWYDLDRLGRLFDPWNDLDRLNRFSSGQQTQQAIEFPAINVWVANDNAMVTTELPGIDAKSIEISVVSDTLTLRGSRKSDETDKSESFHRRERWQGQFSKTIQLPFPIQVDKIEARYTKGVLSITLPRAEADKPRKISIKSE
jgi:HSP20 family protein